MKSIGKEVRDSLLLDVKHGELTAISAKKPERRRYKLSELVDCVAHKDMDELIRASAHVQDGPPVGEELQ